MYGGMWTSPLSDKVSFLCVVYVQGASKHHPNIWGHPNIGAVQTYRGHSNIGSTQHTGASKHMGAYKHTGGHPNICGHLSFSSQTHSHLPRLVPTICTKKNLHSFILTQLNDGSHLEFCHLGFRHYHLRFRHLVIFSQIHSKTLSLHSDSDSN